MKTSEWRESAVLGTWPLARWFVACLQATCTVLLAGCGGQGLDAELVASGYIEADEVTVASEVRGTIEDILVQRGDNVGVGDILVVLDSSIVEAQRLEAEAALAAAEANLAAVVSGPRGQEVTAARSELAAARAEALGAARAVMHAREAISNPVTADVQIGTAQLNVEMAEQRAELLRADLAAVELQRNHYVGDGGDQKRIWDLQLQAANAALTAAEADLDGTQRYLDLLLEARDNPLELKAQLVGRETEHALAVAAVGKASAVLEEKTNGPTEFEIREAEVFVGQADAALGLIEAKVEQYQLSAWMDGIVVGVRAHRGETVMPGACVLSIANVDSVSLVVYVPANRLGEVRLGQEVDLQVDSFPGRVFVGHVAGIADEAEFTPRNVTTQEQRVSLVYATTVMVVNPDHLLKPGMPADVRFAKPGGKSG
jgi:HlyD family secretion protein